MRLAGCGGWVESSWEIKMSNSKSILDQQTIQNPYPLFEELRRERPITYMPELKGYFVSSYALAKKVLIDKRFGKTPTVKDGTKFVPAHPTAREILLRDKEIGLPIHCFSESDGPRFTAFRKMAEPFFTRISAPAMEREVQACADLLLDEIEKLDTCDLPSQYSSPFTTAIICKLVGVPRSMEREMRDYADASLAYRARVLSESEAVATAETLVRMHSVVRELLDERKANPQQDLMSVLTQATVEGAPLSLREQVYIVEEVVMGGSETTANAINAGLMYLGSHPELQDRIRKNPAQIPTFMEEVLRLLPPDPICPSPRPGGSRDRRRDDQGRRESLCRDRRARTATRRSSNARRISITSATIRNSTSPSAADRITVWVLALRASSSACPIRAGSSASPPSS